MSLKDTIDFSQVATPEEANELRSNFIRKAFEYDSYADQTRFVAVVLSEPIPLRATDVKHFTNVPEQVFLDTVRQSLASATGGPRRISKFAFKGRIVGHNSPHWFLPDPCDPAYSNDSAKLLKIIATHTTFVSTEDYQLQSGKKLPNRGDLVLVELDKNDFGYNLQAGRFVDVMEATDAYHNIDNYVDESCRISLADSFTGRGGGAPAPAPGGMGGGAGTAGIPVPGCPRRIKGRCVCGGRPDRVTRKAHKAAEARGEPSSTHEHYHEQIGVPPSVNRRKPGDPTKYEVPVEGCGSKDDPTFAKCSRPSYTKLPQKASAGFSRFTNRQIVEAIIATGAPLRVQKIMYAITKKEQPAGRFLDMNPSGIQLDVGGWPGTVESDYDYQSCFRDNGGVYRIFAGWETLESMMRAYRKIIETRAKGGGWYELSDYMGDTQVHKLIIEDEIDSMLYNYYKAWVYRGSDEEVTNYIATGVHPKGRFKNVGPSGIALTRGTFEKALTEYYSIYQEINGTDAFVAEGGPPAEGDTGMYGSTTIPAE